MSGWSSIEHSVELNVLLGLAAVVAAYEEEDKDKNCESDYDPEPVILRGSAAILICVRVCLTGWPDALFFSDFCAASAWASQSGACHS